MIFVGCINAHVRGELEISGVAKPCDSKCERFMEVYEHE